MADGGSTARRWRRGLAVGFLLLVAAVIGAFALLQTPPGLAWLSRVAARALSGPGATVRIEGLAGFVPFHLRASRLDVSDDRGVWLVLDEVRLDLSPGALFAGRLHLTRLSAAAATMHRLPEATSAGPAVPLDEQLRPPHLALPLAIDRFGVEHVRLDAAVLGEPVTATLSGEAAFARRTTRLAVDLHRTDSVPGSLALEMAVDGAPPVLKLRLDASEPTGALLARLLDRPDRLPLALSLTGEGPISAWRGRLEATAGDRAGIDGDLDLAVRRDITVGLTATARVGALLPAGIVPLVGDRVPLTLHARLDENGLLSVDALSAEIAAGKLTATAELGRPDRAIAAHLVADLPRLTQASAPLGIPVGGSARIDVTVGGTEERPTLTLDATGNAVQLGMSGVARATAHLSVAPTGAPDDRAAPVAIAAQGRVEGLKVPPGTPFPPGVSRDIDWSLAARVAPDLATVDLTRFAAQGAGIDISGSGKLAGGGRALDGRLRVNIADLRPFTGLFGAPVAGALTLTATATQPNPNRITAALDGSISGFASGDSLLDALAGRSVKIAGTAQRDADGALVVDRLALTGAAASLAGTGRFDPATRHLAVTLDGDIPDLRPLGPALATELQGRITLNASAEGALDRLAAKVQLDGADLAAGGARLDRLELAAQLPDLAQPRATVDGSFRSGDLDGRLALEVDASNPREWDISRLRVNAAGGQLDGRLRIDPATWLAQGAIGGAVPDLARWSRLAGTRLAGSVSLKAGLAARNGQQLDLTLTGDRLAVGSGSSGAAIDRFALSGTVNDLRGLPYGTARATVTGTSVAAGRIERASMTLDSKRPGDIAYTLDATGKFAEPFTLSLGGTGEIAPRDNAITIRIARLGGSLGADPIRLTRPLVLSRRGDDLALSDLALTYGRGQITGSAALRGSALSLRTSGRNLSVASAARLAGFPRANGTLGFDASVDGTLSAPRGRFSLTGRALSLSLPQQGRLPSLGLDLSGDWNGRRLAFDGRVSGLKGDTIAVSGGLPLVLTPAPLGLAMPSDGSMTVRVRGTGELASLADLLPLGEDRLTGRFNIDASVTGSLASPTAGGRLTIANGRYENFTSGAVLTNMQAEIDGSGDRFVLRRFTARDSASGSLSGQGGLVLDDPRGPSVDLSATLKEFRLAALDEGVATASGTVTVKGPVDAPNVGADLTVERGDFRIPDRLPPSVVRLQVVEVPPRAGKAPAGAAPSLPVPLDLKLSLPGRIFVRGRGLNSEWRGRLHITGTSDAPQVSGSLEPVRGTFDLLGKTFQVTEGRITFGGGPILDPAINLTASVTAGGITAQAVLGGVLSAPTVTLTSVPVLPQDEILARVLFDRPLGQVSVAEGLQVAQAAAALAGGGPDLIERLRGRLGLDRLVFGSAPSTSTNAGGALNGTTISAGKYIASGIYVGATQGLTGRSSKVTVEIELRPNVTVETDVGTAGDSGIGLNYRYDY